MNRSEFQQRIKHVTEIYNKAPWHAHKAIDAFYEATIGANVPKCPECRTNTAPQPCEECRIEKKEGK